MTALLFYVAVILASAQTRRAQALHDNVPIDYIPADEPVFDALQGGF